MNNSHSCLARNCKTGTLLLAFSLNSGFLMANEAPVTSSSGEQTRAAFKFRNGETHSRTIANVDGTAMVEGDIIVGNSADFFTSPNKRHVRGLSNSSYGKIWPNGLVPYQLNSNLTTATKEKVLAAVDHWNAVGSVTLIARNDANASAYPNYIDFVDENRCASWIGFQQSGPQSIYTGDKCSAGSMIHEIGHALGLLHEHTRPDRDNFVTIHWDRIKDGMELNFEVISGSVTLGPYDYGSIMHYGTNFFSNNGQPTIEPLLPTEASIGQRVATSAGDKASVAQLYQSDLSLVINAESPSTVSGTDTEVTIHVTNIGQVGANSLSVQIPIPVDTSLLSFNSPHWTCVEYADTNTVFCDSPVLTPGTESVVTISLSATMTPGPMTLEATLTSRTLDTNTNNNRDTTTITVLPSNGENRLIAAAPQEAQDSGLTIGAAMDGNTNSGVGGIDDSSGGGSLNPVGISLLLLLMPLSRRRNSPVLG